MNPIGLLLVVGGIVAIIVGVRGTQSGTFAALTGKSATTGNAASSAASTTSTVPTSPATRPAPTAVLL